MSKKLLLLLLIPALLLVGGYLYVRFSLQSSIHAEEHKSGAVLPTTKKLGNEKLSAADLRPLFIKRMQQLLKKSSNNLYDLSINDLKIDLLASTISLQGVKMQPDKPILDSLKKLGKTPSDVFTVSFDSLEIEGVNVDDAINSKVMDYKLVKLVHPLIVVHHIKKSAKKTTEEEGSFSERFLKEMEKLSVKKIVVEDGTMAIYNDTKNGSLNKINHLSIEMNDLLVDSTTRKEVNRFLFARSATISLRDYNKPTQDRLYNLHIGAAVIKAPQGHMTLSDLSFTTPLSKAAFMARHKFSTSLYHLVVPSLTVHNVDWWALLNEEEIVADEVTADKGTVSVYLDRTLPSEPAFNNYPSQLLMQLALPVHISKVDLRNMNFSYEEFNPLSGEGGTMYMDNASLSVTNIDNHKGGAAKPVEVKASALFMHQVPLQADFTFNMVHYKTGDFTSHIKAPGFDTRIVNSFAVPMGMVKVEKGTMQSIAATITGNQSGATADVFLPYTDLKLTLMEKNKDRPGVNKKHITSAFANLLFIKNNNPQKGGEPRKETASYKAPPGTPFFSVIWKSLLVGALKTIGAPEKVAYETVPPVKK